MPCHSRVPVPRLGPEIAIWWPIHANHFPLSVLLLGRVVLLPGNPLILPLWTPDQSQTNQMLETILAMLIQRRPWGNANKCLRESVTQEFYTQFYCSLRIEAMGKCTRRTQGMNSPEPFLENQLEVKLQPKSDEKLS